MSSITIHPTKAAGPVPLENGDRMTLEEFHRRYLSMPGVKKAELIEGIVYMPSPVRAAFHGRPHAKLCSWLSAYEDATDGTFMADNVTIILDKNNEPQPDLVLMKLPEHGGQARISPNDYIEGAPEFVAEIVASTRAYDLHQKKEAYRRNGIREYLAWIVPDKRIVWWELDAGEYRELLPDTEGVIRSHVFPGLWLNAAAMIAEDMKSVLATLEQGLADANS